MRLFEDGLREIRRSGHRIGEGGAAQIRAAQVRRGQVAPRKVGSFELQPTRCRRPTTQACPGLWAAGDPGRIAEPLRSRPPRIGCATPKARSGEAATRARKAAVRACGVVARRKCRLEAGAARPCRRIRVLVGHDHPADFGPRASAQPASARPGSPASTECAGRRAPVAPIRTSGVPRSAGPSPGGRTGWPRDRPGSARSCRDRRGRG